MPGLKQGAMNRMRRLERKENSCRPETKTLWEVPDLDGFIPNLLYGVLAPGERQGTPFAGIEVFGIGGTIGITL